MDSFEQILLRLKERLGMQSNREVAAALRMTEKAFHARKRRGAFPEEKLLAFSALHPELHLDVFYVLTGQPATTQSEGLSRMYATTLEARERVATRSKKSSKAAAESLPSDKEELLDHYDRADTRGKAAIMATARAMSGGRPSSSPAVGGSQQNFYGEVSGGQQAGRDIVNPSTRKRGKKEDS